MLAGAAVTDEARAAAAQPDRGGASVKARSVIRHPGPRREPVEDADRGRGATAELGAARRRDRAPRPALLHATTRPRSRTPTMTRCAGATQAIEARFPELIRADSPSRPGRRRAGRGFAKVTHSVPMLSLDNALAEEEVREFVARSAASSAGRRISRWSPRMRSRSWPSRRSTACPLAALRGRRAGARRHARRRHDRRGRHRQRPHDPRHPAAARGDGLAACSRCAARSTWSGPTSAR